MAVDIEVENIIKNYFDRNHRGFFSISRFNNTLLFNQINNNYISISDVIFDYDDENIYIKYSLNNIRYMLSMERIHSDNIITSLIVFLSQFMHIYTAGEALRILSQAQNKNIKFFNYSFNFSIIE